MIDGDTVCVSIHLPAVIRLRNCWAPEMTGDESESGKDSRDALVDLLDPPNDVIVNIPTGEARSLTDIMTFGRVVGDIWRPGQDRTVSHEMVSLGFATAEKGAAS